MGRASFLAGSFAAAVLLGGGAPGIAADDAGEGAAAWLRLEPADAPNGSGAAAASDPADHNAMFFPCDGEVDAPGMETGNGAGGSLALRPARRLRPNASAGR